LSDEDDLLKQLEKLSEASASSAKVDSTVDEKINYNARRRLLQGMFLINNKLSMDVAKIAQYSTEKPLVRSHLSQFPPHNLTQEVESASARLTTPRARAWM
jgi:hypothetical protein